MELKANLLDLLSTFKTAEILIHKIYVNTNPTIYVLIQAYTKYAVAYEEIADRVAGLIGIESLDLQKIILDQLTILDELKTFDELNETQRTLAIEGYCLLKAKASLELVNALKKRKDNKMHLLTLKNCLERIVTDISDDIESLKRLK